MKALQYLNKYFFKYKYRLLVGIIITFCSKILALQVPRLISESVDKAATYIINDKLEKIDARGGVIALDKDGNISMPFNTSGMFRGYKKSKGKIVVLLYKD